MDDLLITISLSELKTLIETSKSSSGMESSLASLSRRIDGLYALYVEVFHRLLHHEVDSL